MGCGGSQDTNTHTQQKLEPEASGPSADVHPEDDASATYVDPDQFPLGVSEDVKTRSDWIFNIPNLDAGSRRHEKEVQEAYIRVERECVDSACMEESAVAQNLLAMDKRVSDRLPLSRTLPDTRAQPCLEAHHGQAGTATVIIPFHNEITSALLRTAQSVLDRTDPKLLLEVVLVSDGPSEAPWAAAQHREIAAFCAAHKKVQHLELPEHLGLAPAKVAGARLAKGDVVVFLDSHCEVNEGWYEPLAAPIAGDRGVVTVPIIDSIGADDLRYSLLNEPVKGVFTWGMYYAGTPFSPEEYDELASGRAVGMPIMPGGLFAIDRTFFEELGYYDEGLRIWGAENVELSLKIWRCGGRVDLVPCSRVGHIFKSAQQRFPPGESRDKNFKRVAEVWLDEYKDIYYQSFPIATTVDAGDLTEAHAARARLQCKSMSWFLENVYPAMFVPRNYVQQGLLASTSGLGCVDMRMAVLASNPRQDPHIAPAHILECHDFSDQWYLMEDTQHLVHIGIWTEECLGVYTGGGALDATAPYAQVVVCQCAKYPDSGCSADEVRWRWEGGRLLHVPTNRCLTVQGPKDASGYGSLVASLDCEELPELSRWHFVDRRAAGQEFRRGAEL